MKKLPNRQERMRHEVQLLPDYEQSFLDIQRFTRIKPKSLQAEFALDVAVYILQNHPELIQKIKPGQKLYARC